MCSLLDDVLLCPSTTVGRFWDQHHSQRADDGPAKRLLKIDQLYLFLSPVVHNLIFFVKNNHN